MQRLFACLILLSMAFIHSTAQNFPVRWIGFTTGEYIYAIEEDNYSSKQSQVDFINSLLDRARLNVAKQVKISVSDNAKLVKSSLNGISSISYSSETVFSTDATMHLLRCDSEFRPDAKKGYAIAYLDKREVRDYCEKEAYRLLTQLESEFATAKKMIALGYKDRAKSILGSIQPYYNDLNEPLSWLGLCSYPEEDYQVLLDRISRCFKQINDTLLSLGHGVAIYIDYQSDLFGEEYPAALNQLSSMLASEDRSFIDNPIDADWIIKVSAKAREGQTTVLNTKSAYFSYVDVNVTIIKGCTGQTVFKNAFSIKEGDTRGFKQSASTAFNKLAVRLYDQINDTINQE